MLASKASKATALGPGQEEFIDKSIAAFYSHRKSVFSVSLHPSYPNLPWRSAAAKTMAAGSGTLRTALKSSASAVTRQRHLGALQRRRRPRRYGGMDGKVRVWRKRSDDFKSWEFLTNLEGPMRSSGSTGIPRAACSPPAAPTPPSGCGSSQGTDMKRLLWPQRRSLVRQLHPRRQASHHRLRRRHSHRLGPKDGRNHLQGPDPHRRRPHSARRLADARVVVIGGAAGDVRVINIGALDNGGAASVVASLTATQTESPSRASSSSTSARQPQRPRHHRLHRRQGDRLGPLLGKDALRGRARRCHHRRRPPPRHHPLLHLLRRPHHQDLGRKDRRLHRHTAGLHRRRLALAVGKDDGFTQGADTGGIGAYTNTANARGWKLIGAGDEGVALVFRV